MNSLRDVGDGADGGRVRVLSQDQYKGHAWSFFIQNKGSSWHGKDARLIFWMGSHWFMLTVLGFLIAGVVGVGLYWAWGRVFFLGQRSSQGRRAWGFSRRRRSPKREYEPVNRHEV